MEEFFCPACRNALEDGEYCEDCGRMRCPNRCGNYINRMQDEVQCRYCTATDEYFCPDCENALKDGEYCEDCGRMRCPNGCGHFIDRMQDEVECRYCTPDAFEAEREAEKLKAERDAELRFRFTPEQLEAERQARFEAEREAEWRFIPEKLTAQEWKAERMKEQEKRRAEGEKVFQEKLNAQREARREAKSVNQNLEVGSLAHEASKLLRLRMPGWAKPGWAPAPNYAPFSAIRDDRYEYVDSIYGRKKTGPIKWNLFVGILLYDKESIVGFAYKEWVSAYNYGDHRLRPDDEIFRLPLTEANIPLAVDKCVDYLLLMKNKRL